MVQINCNDEYVSNNDDHIINGKMEVIILMKIITSNIRHNNTIRRCVNVQGSGIKFSNKFKRENWS